MFSMSNWFPAQSTYDSAKYLLIFTTYRKIPINDVAQKIMLLKNTAAQILNAQVRK